MRALALGVILLGLLSTPSRAEELVVLGAGSLREVMGAVASAFAKSRGITVTTRFGPSGGLRERIEGGEHADLFTSADTGHPRRLVQEGRASVMAVFARNELCVLSPPAFGATADTVVAKLLAAGVRLGISQARLDPLGDYTEILFDRLDRMKPGSAAALRSAAVVMDLRPNAPAPRSGDLEADAMNDHRIDAAIVYCSARGRYARLLPDAAMVQLPPLLRIGPQYGLAVMKDARPEAALLALYILSPEGQAALARFGFMPVTPLVGR